MKTLEAILWENIVLEQGGNKIFATPNLHELYEKLPTKLQNLVSMTTVLFALLNLANKKGFAVNPNKQLEDCQVEHLKRITRSSFLHPAIAESSPSSG